MYNKQRIFLLVIILISASFLYAQTDSEIDKQFDRAVNLYQSGDYTKALLIFKKIAIQLPYNQKTTAAYIFIGKTYMQTNDFPSARRYLQDFLDNYPDSKYKDEAYLIFAKINYMGEDYKNAFEYLLKVAADSSQPGNQKYSVSLGEKLAVNYIGKSDLIKYNDTTSNSSLKAYLLLLIGEKEQSENDFDGASQTFKELIDKYPDSEFSVKARKLIKKTVIQNREAIPENLIAILLPLHNESTGEKIEAAGEVLEGIKYAAAVYNREHENKIGLLIKDTGSDSAKISEICKEINSFPEVKAIIGPIFSNEVRYTLEDFKNSEIPIISPTATDNDLPGLSKNFFQANPSFAMRGKVIAQYIYYVTGKRNMGILNAAQGYSPLLATAFMNEFQKLGGKIIVSSTYNSGSYDLSQPVSALAVDSAELEGIYIPLSNKMDAASLLSQLVKDQINKPLYGNQDWFFAKGFETSSELSNQLSFTSDFFIDYTDSSFISFSKEFTQQTGTDIDRNVLYGYDTANYLLNLFDNGAESRSALIHMMESGIEVKGYHNNIAFGMEHTNKFLNIIRYKEGKFELVDHFKSGD